MVHILHDAERCLLPPLPVQMPAIQLDLSACSRISPHRHRERVVLPTPLGPVMATTSPGGLKGQALKHSRFFPIGTGQSLY